MLGRIVLNLEIGGNFQAKILKNTFKWIISYIEGVIEVIFSIKLLLCTFKIKGMVVVCSIPCPRTS